MLERDGWADLDSSLATLASEKRELPSSDGAWVQRGRWCGLWRGSEARAGASTFKWYLVSAAHALRCSLFHLEVGSAGEKGEVVCVSRSDFTQIDTGIYLMSGAIWM